MISGQEFELLKKAFYDTFHKSGELWFDYLSSEEENKQSTEYYWNEFLDNLRKELNDAT